MYFLLAALAFAGLIVLLREHRPLISPSGAALYAYVTTADGSITVVDLVKLKAFSHMYVGPGLSGLREHPTRAEVFGVSSAGGYVWILDPRINQVTARIPVGPLPYAVEFSRMANGFTPRLPATTCSSRWTPNRTPSSPAPPPATNPSSPASLRTENPSWWSIVATAPSAFTTLGRWRSAPRLPSSRSRKTSLSCGQLRGLCAQPLRAPHLRRGPAPRRPDGKSELAGKPTDMLLKPDGGELYVISPEAHGLQAINTWTHEVGDYMVLGSAPTRGVLSADASLLYVSDTAAGRVTPVDIYNRRIIRDPGKGFPSSRRCAVRAALRSGGEFAPRREPGLRRSRRDSRAHQFSRDHDSRRRSPPGACRELF